MIYDVIIIGAGPAGAAASIRLADKGHHVLLLEKSRFPREKLCGEFISPECLGIFERLGVRERIFEAGARSIRTFMLFAPDGRSLEIPMEWIADGHPHAISLTRARMDSIMLDRARNAGVEIREGFQVSPRFHRESELGIVEGKADGETIERFYAPAVIDASGRNGLFSTQGSGKIPIFRGSRLFGCKVHLRGVDHTPETGELFFFQDGYGGITEVEGGRSNLCFLTTETIMREARGDREKLLDLTVRSNPAALKRLKNASIAGEWHGAGPIIFGHKRSIPGVPAIGDAGAFIDPFTGSGILLALTSGEIVADVIDQSFAQGIRDIEKISARYKEIHRSHFGLRYKASALLRRLAFKPIARNALISLLSRRKSLMKMIALSTRRGRIAG